MNSLKKEVITVFVLLVIAVAGIYIANAETISQDSENQVITASEIVMASSDTEAGHYPCKKPSTPRSSCKKSGAGCRAWKVYDACVDGTLFCD